MMILCAAVGFASDRPFLAKPIAGVDYRPTSQAELAWIEQGQASSSLLGEEDGILRPPIEPWVGWGFGRTSITVGAALRLESWTQFTSESLSHEHTGGIRIQTDGRHYMGEGGASSLSGAESGPPGPGLHPFAGLGIHGTIPFASTHSDLYSDEEQEEYDAAAAERRAEIAGIGGRGSLGAEKRWEDGLSLALRWDLVLHWNQQSLDSGVERRFLLKSEPVLSLGFRF
jgi:hypothetical protein